MMRDYVQPMEYMYQEKDECKILKTNTKSTFVLVLAAAFSLLLPVVLSYIAIASLAGIYVLINLIR